MKKFFPGDRVCVRNKAGLKDKIGTVVRLLFSSPDAWVSMDTRPAEAYCLFPEHDPRANWVLLRPDQCKAPAEQDETQPGTDDLKPEDYPSGSGKGRHATVGNKKP